MASPEKTCSKCGVPRPLTEFSARKGASDGFNGKCKACRKAYNKTWMAGYRPTPEHKERQKKYQKANASRIRANNRASANARRKDPVQRQHERDQHFRRLYGVTREELSEKQGGRCAICGVEFATLDPQLWHVDHCHTSGVTRGLLCQGCNTALGKFNDSAALLRKAADYLDQFEVFK